MNSQADADSMRAMLLLFAAVVALVTAVINAINTRAQSANTEEEKQVAYYGVMRWVEIGFWTAGAVASMFFGLVISLFFFLAAYILGCGLFLKSRSPFLRTEILQLVVSTGAVVFYACMYFVGEAMSQILQLTQIMDKLANALAGK